MTEFEEKIKLKDYFKSRDVILDFNKKQIIKMSEIINNQKDRIEQLESENSLFRFVFENKSLDNLGVIAPESKDNILHKEKLINDKALEIDALKGIINDLRNYLHNDVKESLEYKLILQNCNQAIQKRNELVNLVNSLTAEINEMKERMYYAQSKTSAYIDKYLYLKEQIQLVMDASPIQRLNRKNLKGISYDEIQLEPQE